MGVNMDSVSKQAKRNRDHLENYVFNKNIAFYNEELGIPLKILRECEKVKSEVTWYRTMLSHPFVKFAFSIQIRIDRIVDIIKYVR